MPCKCLQLCSLPFFNLRGPRFSFLQWCSVITHSVFGFFSPPFLYFFFYTKFCKSLQFLYNKVKGEIYPCVWCLIPNKEYKKWTLFLYASEILWEEYAFLFKPHLSCYWLTLETSLWVVATLAGQKRTALINWNVLPQMFTDVVRTPPFGHAWQ